MKDVMFRIAGQNARIAGGTLCRLLSGFEAPESEKDQQPICTIAEATGTAQFDIINLTPDFQIRHVLSTVEDPSGVALADEDYSHISITFGESKDESLMELLLAAFYSRLVAFRTVLVHASVVDVPGLGGVMFVGRSGIGKTTQAMLWSMYRNAEIINGDKVFLSLNEAGDTVTAHGNPWKGSSPYCLNKSTTLKGIVVLDQAKTNTIRQLNDLEVLNEYVTHIFMPMWNGQSTDQVMETIGGMMPLVPVFKLACRPEQEAVDMTFRAIFGSEV